MFDPADDDPLEVIAAQLARLEAQVDDWVDWSGPAQTARVVGLTQLHGRLEALTARAAGTWEASGAWTADGSRYPTNSLARRSGRGPGVTRRVLGVGRLTHTFPATAKALTAGDLPIDHAHALAQAVSSREELYPDYEADLLAAATRLNLRDYRRVLAVFAELADERLGRHNEARAHEQRGFAIDALLDGVSAIDGTAEPEGAAIIRAALDAYAHHDPADMPGPRRTPRQIRYDALIAALAASINGAVPGRPKRSIDAIVSLELLTGDDPTDLATTRSDLVRVGVVPPALIRRLAAHSTIGRIIATANGLPLDVGAQVQSFPRGQRRAIRYRDQTCVWPGCGLPGEWTEIDHIHQHAHGGPTSITNGRFLCVRHHHLRHQGWTLHWDPTTRHAHVTSPHGITYTSDPDPPPGPRNPQAQPLPPPRDP